MKTWRRAEGKFSRGRVKGIAETFEKENTSLQSFPRGRASSLTSEIEQVAKLRQRRNRQSSGRSFVSADGNEDQSDEAEVGQENPSMAPFDWSQVEPFPIETVGDLSPATLSDTSPMPVLNQNVCPAEPGSLDKFTSLQEGQVESLERSYQSNMLSHGDAAYSPNRNLKPLTAPLMRCEDLSQILEPKDGYALNPTKPGLIASDSLSLFCASSVDANDKGHTSTQTVDIPFASVSGISTVNEHSLHIRSHGSDLVLDHTVHPADPGSLDTSRSLQAGQQGQEESLENWYQSKIHTHGEAAYFPVRNLKAPENLLALYEDLSRELRIEDMKTSSSSSTEPGLTDSNSLSSLCTSSLDTANEGLTRVKKEVDQYASVDASFDSIKRALTSVRKISKRRSDLKAPFDDSAIDEDHKYFIIKHRDASMVVIERKELEEVRNIVLAQMIGTT